MTTQTALECDTIPMKILEVALLISSIVWCAAAVYFIYGVGLSILTLDIRPGLTALILILLATGAQFLIVMLVG
jgi:hypothetical protein